MALVRQLALETVRLGLKNLRLHKLRSLLTALGIIFGVGAVICMLSISEGRSASQLELIRMLGSNNVIVKSKKPQESSTTGENTRLLTYGITQQDVDRIRASVPMIKRIVAMREVAFTLRRQDRKFPGVVVGADPAFFQIVRLQLARGRFLSGYDNETRQKVCVLGGGIAKELFRYEDPIGKTVTVMSLGKPMQAFTVVGVLAEVETAGVPARGIAKRDSNHDVYIPFRTADALFGTMTVIIRSGSQEFRKAEYSDLYLEVADSEHVKEVSEMVRQVMEAGHATQDYTITVPLELLMQIKAEKRNRQLILGIIAGVSLVVAGIGIMNIMLATVTERTREIGIRRALGAKQRHIAQQFLVETLVLTMVGGSLGVVAGSLGALVLTRLANWPTIITLWSVITSVGVAALVGIFFGMYPAMAAAKLDPIEALRHE